MEDDSKNQNSNKNTEESIEALKAELAKLQSEKDEYLNGWKRAKADFINYKKDESARAEEIIKFGARSILKDLLAVMDSFDLAAASPNEEVIKSLSVIKSQLTDFLKRHGVEKIEVEIGKDFNPALHEALSEIESEYPGGTIAKEVGSGYTLYGQVVRPAKVIITKSS